VTNKLQLLLSLRDGKQGQALTELLVKEGQAATSSLPEVYYRHAVRLPGDPTANVPQDGQTETAAPPPSFDVMFELRSEDTPLQEMTNSISGIGHRLESIIDRSQSAALAGAEYTVIPGTQPLLLIMALRRRPSLSREQFHDFWQNHHAEDVRESVTGLQGYRQFHAHEHATRQAAALSGLAIDDLEGTAEGYYASMEEFLEIMARPEVSADAGFIDHSRSVMWLYALAHASSPS
jgi:hypothetical protein|tara:strand:+ start:1055 stop:1759 length:705 start_codon:yes stop_codon:yes gene_type:complete